MRIAKPFIEVSANIGGDIIAAKFQINKSVETSYFSDVFRIEVQPDGSSVVKDQSFEMNPIYFDKWVAGPPKGYGFYNPLTEKEEQLREFSEDELAALSEYWGTPIKSWRDLISDADKRILMDMAFNPKEDLFIDPLLKAFGISLNDLRVDPKAAFQRALATFPGKPSKK